MSERGFSATIESELEAQVANIALLVYLDWPGGEARYWTGVGDLSYDSANWTGVGNLGHIDKVADSLEKSDIGVELSLSLLDDDIRNEVTGADPRGRTGEIYLAVIDPTTKTVDDGYLLFPGFIDRVEIEDGGSSGVIRVRVISELALLRKTRWIQLSDAHQQWLFPGDDGMEFASKMDEPVMWGRKPLQPSTAPPPPSTPRRPTAEDYGVYY